MPRLRRKREQAWQTSANTKRTRSTGQTLPGFPRWCSSTVCGCSPAAGTGGGQFSRRPATPPWPRTGPTTRHRRGGERAPRGVRPQVPRPDRGPLRGRHRQARPQAGRDRSQLRRPPHPDPRRPGRDRKSTRLNSSHPSTSYAVFCLKKKNHTQLPHTEEGVRLLASHRLQISILAFSADIMRAIAVIPYIDNQLFLHFRQIEICCTHHLKNRGPNELQKCDEL